MSWQSLLEQLFPQGHDVQRAGDLLHGTGRLNERAIAVIGSAERAAVGVELALALAGLVLQTIREHPCRAILLLVDTQGQRLRHRDELLGINSYMAHLAQCIDLARRNGHRIISLVHGDAVSGGYIAGGMMADACFALPTAEISVMNLPAMARVTKIPRERLEELSKSSPVFAPGSVNYLKMGALDSIWEGALAGQLEHAISETNTLDQRRQRGTARRGRLRAESIAQRVRDAD